MRTVRTTIYKATFVLAWTCALSACAAPERIVPPQRSSISRVTGVQHLYVLNDGGPEGLNSVAVYALGASKPSRVIKKGVYDPKALSIDPLGNIYVANYFTNDVAAYRRGARLPARYITGFQFPEGLALDGSGDLAVMSTDEVGVYDSSGTLQRTIQQDASLGYTPTAVGFDSTGNLWVKSIVAKQLELDEYPPGNNMPVLTITSAVGGPPLTFDASGNVYSETYHHGIAVYASLSVTPIRVIPHGAEVLCMATDQSGHLYVGSKHAITVYDAATGSLRYVIEKGIHWPTSIALDASGNLYVANLGNNTVSVYASDSDEIVRALGVKMPSAIAIGR